VDFVICILVKDACLFLSYLIEFCLAPIVTDRVAWSVCHLVSPAKTAEATEMPFASTTLMGPGKHLLHIADRFGRILYCVYSTQYISLLVVIMITSNYLI